MRIATNMNSTLAHAYTQEKASKSGSSFYYSFLFLKPQERKAITALYAFCREVDDCVDEVSQADIAERKLGFWEAEIERLFAGNPQHPVSFALQDFLSTYHWEKSWFLEIIAGMRMDLQYQGYETFSDLEQYCYKVAGVVGMLTSQITSSLDPAVLTFAQKLGTSLQLINIIRDVGEDARRNRIYIPEALLQSHDIDPQKILSLKGQPALAKALADLAHKARGFYQEAMQILPSCQHYSQRVGIIMANVYLALLEVMEEDHFPVLNTRYSLPPFRKIWIAWRTNRRLKRLIA